MAAATASVIAVVCQVISPGFYQPTFPLTELKRARIAIITVPIIWGTTFAITQTALDEISPVLFALLRFLITIGIFIAFFPDARRGAMIALRGRDQPAKHLRTDSLMLGGLLGVGYALQFIGLQTSSTTDSAFITSTAAIWTPFFAYFVIGEFIAKKTLLAMAVAVVGLVLLTQPYHMDRIVTGDILTLISAICFGFYIAWIDKAMPRAENLMGSARSAGLVISGNQMIAAALLLGIVLPFVETPKLILSKDLVSALLYNAVLATALTTYLQNRYQSVLTATVAALIFMLEPVVAGFVGFIFLDEYPGVMEIAGALLIILGVIIAQVRWGRVKGAG